MPNSISKTAFPPPPISSPMLLNKLETYLLCLGVSLRFLVSNALLNMLYPYAAEAGSPLMKVHPGTYIIFLSFMLMLGRLNVFRVIFNQIRRNFSAILFLFVVSFIAIYSTWRFGLSGLAYLIDTWIVAIIVAIMLKYLKAEILAIIGKSILIFILINSIVALLEYSLKTQFMPYDDYRFFASFRSSSFLGHPLANSLITSLMVLLVFATRWKTTAKWFFALIYLSAIMAFGARAAFAVGIFMLSLQQILSFSYNLIKGRLSLAQIGIAPFVFLLIPLLIFSLLFFTDLGTRIIEMATLQDSSAYARFRIGTIFEYVQPDQLLWGLSSSEREIITIKNQYFSVIENFWVALMLNFGLVLFTLFAISFLFFLYGMVRKNGLAVWLAVSTFTLVASSNNSLATKTPSLIFLVCTIAGVTAIIQLNKTKQNNDKKTTSRNKADQSDGANGAI